MTVKELKLLLKDVPDNVQVIIPQSHEFDGAFYSPCVEESGASMMGTDMDLSDEDIAESELLNKELPEELMFVLVPHGFFDEKDYTHELN